MGRVEARGTSVPCGPPASDPGPIARVAPLELAAEATITSWLRGGTVAEAVAGRFDGPVTSWDPWSHLWFLWVLLLVSVGWSALPSTLTARLGDAAVRPRWLVVGLVVQAFALATSPSVVLPPGCGFVPPLLPTLVFAGWFLVGTGAWERRDDALRRLARWAPATSALAVAAFVGAIAGQAAREALTDGVVGAGVVAGLATISSVATAAFAAAAVGWAHRASIPERTGEYVARSSYWVYLSHHAPAMVVPAVGRGAAGSVAGPRGARDGHRRRVLPRDVADRAPHPGRVVARRRRPDGSEAVGPRPPVGRPT
jgi:hypothetical protein